MPTCRRKPQYQPRYQWPKALPPPHAPRRKHARALGHQEIARLPDNPASNSGTHSQKKVRGNDLAYAAAKLAVRSFDTLPPAQTTRVEVGEIAPHPKDWVLYTFKPRILTITPVIPNTCPTTPRPGWTILEEGRLQMHVFTRPSRQVRLKARHALLRSLHHTSMYRRLIVTNREMGARLHTVGQPTH